MNLTFEWENLEVRRLLMLNAGLRASEVLSLAVRDLDWNSGKISIKCGKGDKVEVR